MPKNSSPKKKPLQQPADVLVEIQRRREAGRPLNSGANRGDWLYAAAIRHFGSWGAALEAAGVDSRKVQRAGLTRDDVLRRIGDAVARGEPLRAGRDRILAAGALRHFGSWRAALKAAGFENLRFLKWTPEAVIARIREGLRNGLSMRVTDVIEREEALYKAGRDRFGSWGAALKATDPSLPEPRQGRPRKPPAILDLPGLTQVEARRQSMVGRHKAREYLLGRGIAESTAQDFGKRVQPAAVRLGRKVRVLLWRESDLAAYVEEVKRGLRALPDD